MSELFARTKIGIFMFCTSVTSIRRTPLGIYMPLKHGFAGTCQSGAQKMGLRSWDPDFWGGHFMTTTFGDMTSSCHFYPPPFWGYPFWTGPDRSWQNLAGTGSLQRASLYIIEVLYTGLARVGQDLSGVVLGVV